MNSEERRAARRARREEERARKRAERSDGLTIESVADMNALYRAQREAARGVGWKASTQRYQIDWLLNINRMRRDLMTGRDFHRGFHEFDIVERGKRRHISSVHFSERVPQKSLTQNVLIPALRPSLIDRNAANIKGKGVSYSLNALKRDLVRHYAKHGKEGYILLVDFADYFASIDHGAVKSMIASSVDDPGARDLALRFVDVQGERGLGLGSEPNQIEAVSLPNPIDHFVTEMLGVEAYGRYMDDSYMIHGSKQVPARLPRPREGEVRRARHHGQRPEDEDSEALSGLHVPEEEDLLRREREGGDAPMQGLHHPRAPQAQEDALHGGARCHDHGGRAPLVSVVAWVALRSRRARHQALDGRALPGPIQKHGRPPPVTFFTTDQATTRPLARGVFL